MIVISYICLTLIAGRRERDVRVVTRGRRRKEEEEEGRRITVTIYERGKGDRRDGTVFEERDRNRDGRVGFVMVHSTKEIKM